MLMRPHVRYHLHQAGRGKHDGIRPIYAVPPFLKRGYEIGSFLAGLWRMIRPVVWSGAKTLVRETLHIGGNILTVINRTTDGQPRHIVSRRLNETAQNLIGKLRGRGRKRKEGVTKLRQKGGKKPRLPKRDIFSEGASV